MQTKSLYAYSCSRLKLTNFVFRNMDKTYYDFLFHSLELLIALYQFKNWKWTYFLCNTLNVEVTMYVPVKTASVCTYICQFAAVLTNFMAHFFLKLVRHYDKRKLMSLQFHVSYICNRKVWHKMLLLEMQAKMWVKLP